MITVGKCVKLQGGTTDICNLIDNEEEVINDLYQVVTKHYEEAILWEVWEKTFYKTFGKHLVKPKVWKYHLDGVLQNGTAPPFLRSKDDGTRNN